ncbi:hypothetical protein LF841_27540, partial [Pseudomonas aeruginosa]|uniref:hypothetical protein n=1 Tax=Pseudomonas aeruginosa TaxID=287 RepID=UPI00209D636F
GSTLSLPDALPTLAALCQCCVALDEATRTQPQARQQAAYEQAYRRYLEHLPPR